MRSKIFSTIGFALVLSAVSFTQTSTAATAADAAPTSVNSTAAAGPGKIGILDIQGAILNTNEGKRDFEALQKKFEPRQLELKNASDEIESLKKQLAASTDKLSEEERNKRVQTIESKQKSLQRNFEDAQNEFQQQQNELAQRIGTKLMQVVDKYATANNLAMVLDVSGQTTPVLWANPSFNITKAVVDAYNEQSGVAAPAAATRPAGTSSIRPAGTTSTAPKKPATGTTPR